MSVPQIKSIESLIALGLKRKGKHSAKVRLAYTEMMKHFADEEYLYKISHKKIITMIYLNGSYEYLTVEGMSMELFCNFKTLLCYRKAYICLFAKYYLGITNYTDDVLNMLYERLYAEIIGNNTNRNNTVRNNNRKYAPKGKSVKKYDPSG